MKPLNILIADDEALLRLDLREMLEEAGHTVISEAENGKTAVSLAEKYRPDLVIMDVKMPEMDGLEAAKLIGEAKLAPVLLLTADPHAVHVDGMLQRQNVRSLLVHPRKV